MSLIKQSCRLTGKPFTITDREQEFCAKIGVPLSTVCPEERLRRRLCERNSRSLYWRTCDFSKRKILSRHHANVPFPVPRLCPDDRHKNRMQKRNPFTFWERTCVKTGRPMMTTYGPERTEIVYSKEAYLQEIY